jgi:hypothetical protein
MTYGMQPHDAAAARWDLFVQVVFVINDGRACATVSFTFN